MWVADATTMTLYRDVPDNTPSAAVDSIDRLRFATTDTGALLLLYQRDSGPAVVVTEFLPVDEFRFAWNVTQVSLKVNQAVNQYVGASYSGTSIVGGVHPDQSVEYTASANIPQGLKVSAAGYLSGTPLVTANVLVAVSAQNSASEEVLGTNSLRVVVAALANYTTGTYTIDVQDTTQDGMSGWNDGRSDQFAFAINSSSGVRGMFQSCQAFQIKNPLRGDANRDNFVVGVYQAAHNGKDVVVYRNTDKIWPRSYTAATMYIRF